MECVQRPSISASPAIYERSAPIPIGSPTNRKTSEYCLKQNFFDPNKGSPPNPWQQRLLSRMERYTAPASDSRF